MEKLLEPGKFSGRLVRLVGGEEREDLGTRWNPRTGAEPCCNLSLPVGIRPFGVRVVVIDLLVLGESTVVQHLCLSRLSDLSHSSVVTSFWILSAMAASSRRWRYRQQLVCLSSRVSVGPHIGGTIGAIHALAGATRLREGNGVGIVTGHRPPGPVNQAVVIVVLVVVVVRLALGSE